jgi:hypothetical protein
MRTARSWNCKAAAPGRFSRSQMTARQYSEIAALLEKADAITTQERMLTQRGREIQVMLRDLHVKVAAEQIRAEMRDTTPPIPAAGN